MYLVGRNGGGGKRDGRGVPTAGGAGRPPSVGAAEAGEHPYAALRKGDVERPSLQFEWKLDGEAMEKRTMELN